MKILGLDLGSHSVKAVELDAGFGRAEIRDYHELPVTPPLTPAQVAGQLISGLPKTPDRIVLALPQGRTTLRTLDVPTRDKKAIRQAVQFELEDDLPFDLEDSILDQSATPTGTKASRVQVVVTLKKYLTKLVAELNESGVDPDIITSEISSWQALLNRMKPKVKGAEQPAEPPVLVADIGHNRTVFYVHSDRSSVTCREVQWGGRDITFALQSHYRIAEPEAERAKREGGFVLSSRQTLSATKDQLEFSGVITQALAKLVFEIRTTIFSAREAAGAPVAEVYLCGGTALLAGIRNHLEEHLGIAVHPLRGLGSAGGANVTYSEEAEAHCTTALGLALTQVGGEKGASHNFRQGDLARRSGGAGIDLSALASFKSIARGAAIVGVFLAISMITQRIYYASKLAEVDSALEKSMKGFFGDVAKTAVKTYLSNPQKLRDSIESDLKKQREMNRLFGRDTESPMSFLKTLSTRVPKGNLNVDMIQYVVGASPDQPHKPESEKSVSLTFLIDDPKQIPILSKSVSSVLEAPKESAPRETKSLDGQSKKFEVTFTGRPRKDAYGR
jgi:type IV pilus assembly protein PilM